MRLKVLVRSDSVSINFLEEMAVGKGDQRTKRGKLKRGSFGKTRAHKPKVVGAKVVKKAPVKKSPAKKK